MGQEVVQVLFTKDSVKNAFYMTFLYQKIRKGQQKWIEPRSFKWKWIALLKFPLFKKKT